jgi:multiple sugar transport system permease protein
MSRDASAVISSRQRDALRARQSAQSRRLINGTIVTVIGLVIFFVITFPNLWLFDTSFKDANASWAIPPQYIPLHPTLENYQSLLAGAAGAATTRELELWWLYIINSIYTSVIPAVLATFVSTLAGYGFARFRFPGATALLTVLLVGQMFPGPSLFVPIYFLVNVLGLHDNLNALIIIYTAFQIPVGTWICAGFIRSIPLELEEAARIDGASLLQVMYMITIPLAKIGILTMAMLGFMAFWGEFGFASIILEDRMKYTATLGLVRQLTEITSNFNTVGAAATLMGVPLLAVLMFMQRQFVRGLTAGALKEV